MFENLNQFEICHFMVDILFHSSSSFDYFSFSSADNLCIVVVKNVVLVMEKRYRCCAQIGRSRWEQTSLKCSIGPLDPSREKLFHLIDWIGMKWIVSFNNQRQTDHLPALIIFEWNGLIVGEVLFLVDFVSRSVYSNNPYHSKFMVMTHLFNLLGEMIKFIFDVKKKRIRLILSIAFHCYK